MDLGPLSPAQRWAVLGAYVAEYADVIFVRVQVDGRWQNVMPEESEE